MFCCPTRRTQHRGESPEPVLTPAGLPFLPITDFNSVSRSGSMSSAIDQSNNSSDFNPVLARTSMTLQQFIRLPKAPAATREIMPGITGEYIGSGSFGMIYKVTLPEHSQPVAVKLFKRDENHDGFYDLERAEIDIHSRLKAPNIITFLGMLHDDVDQGLDYKLELGFGCLFDYWEKNIRFCAVDILNIVRDVALGLEYLHANHLIHVDLKLENLIICEDAGKPITKICDFGSARPPGVYTSQIFGTVYYTPPETFALIDSESEEKCCTIEPAFDIFCLGLTVYHLLVGLYFYQQYVPNFELATTHDEYYDILYQWYRSKGWETVHHVLTFSSVDDCSYVLFDEFLKYLNTQLMEFRPEYRPSASDVANYMTHLIQKITEQPQHCIPMERTVGTTRVSNAGFFARSKADSATEKPLAHSNSM